MMKRLSILAIALVSVFAATVAFAKGHDIIKINTDVEITKDMVANDVVVIGGNITVFGKIEGNVVAVGGSVNLKPASTVGGQVVVVGGDVAKDPAAAVEGRITQIDMPHFMPSITTFLKGGWLALWATISLLALLGFLGLAILMAALIPEHIGTAVSALEKSFVNMLLWGVFWIILIVPIAALLAISIVGIVLIPLEILLVVLALIIGYIASAIFIGKNIMLSFKKVSLPFVDAILGILVLFLIGFVPVVGAIVKFLFVTAGFGAVLRTRFGTIR